MTGRPLLPHARRLVAIAGSVGALALLPVAGSALELGPMVPGLAGRDNLLEVRGATPGADVVLAMGLKPGPTRVPGCPGLEVEPKVQMLLGPKTANASGVVRFIVTIPTDLLGRLLDAQAVEPAACTVSAAQETAFPPIVEFSMANAEAQLYGADAERAGTAVAAAGDVNADGYGDFLVGARNYGPDNAGAAYLVYGPATGRGPLDTAAGARLVGVEARSYTGAVLASAGDVNGDGYGDVLLGAYVEGPTDTSGAAYLVHGPISGERTLDTAEARLHGSLDERAGVSVASGDLDDDGVPDVIVGASQYYSRLGGRVYILKSPVSGDIDLATESTTMLIGEDARCGEGCSSDHAGRQLGSAGDHDGDGFEDLLVGADSATSPSGSESGSVYLVHGPMPPGSAELIDVAGARLRGAHGGEHFGWTLADAGDTNDDGYRDVIVASVQGYARAFLFLGPLSGDRPETTAEATFYDSAQVEANVVAAAGDVNRDDQADVIIGGYYWDAEPDPGTEGGAFVLFGPMYGSIDMLDAQVLLKGEPGIVGAGVSVAAAGDVDADGAPDLIVGGPSYGAANGIAYLVSGLSL